MKLGDVVPEFGPVDTSKGRMQSWHAAIGNDWAILFSHPADYTPVCTTELGTAAAMYEEFQKRGCKMFALSIDSAESHRGWVSDIESTRWAEGKKVAFPIIADVGGKIAEEYGMFDPMESDGKGNVLTARAVYFIKDKKLRASMLYPASTGRNFPELLRVLDGLQLTDSSKVATPVNWTPGSKCMVLPTIPDDQAKSMFEGGIEYLSVPSGKKYIRMVADPKNKQLAPLAALAEAAIPAATGLLGIVAGFLVATLRKDSDTAKQ